MKVTNHSAGLQGIHTLRGVVFLKPGETRDGLPLTEDHARRADRLPFITVEGQSHPASGPIADPGTSYESAATAAMRRQFDASYEAKCEELRALSDELTAWKQKGTDLEAQLHVARAEIAGLTQQLAAKDGDRGPEGGSLGTTVAEVLAMADDKDVPFMSFKSAASKILGDKTPSTKVEIVAALEELATKP